jgi:hypothetical protein
MERASFSIAVLPPKRTFLMWISPSSNRMADHYHLLARVGSSVRSVTCEDDWDCAVKFLKFTDHCQ